MQETIYSTREPRHEIHTATLANGLRVVCVARHAVVGWCGLAVGAGSRDESEGQYGLAHFVEHTIFKGTTHRRAWHILNRMERVGGELNAYTTKEETMLYTIFPGQHLERAVELLGDLVQNSVFPVDELTREQDVVLEEAASYRDTPSEAIYDDFEDMVLAGSQLGHNVLGVERDLRRLSQAHCLDYLHHLYVPENMVFYYVGDAPVSRVVRLAEKHLGSLARTLQRAPRVVPAVNAPVRLEENIGSHQAHTIVGARLPGMHDPRRHAVALLNNILGGPGMNSLLNVQLRERRGYVYTVESSVAQFSDCALMEIYLGCDPGDVKSSLRVIDHITQDLAGNLIPERRLEAYKRQYCGQMLVAADSAEFMAFNAGKSMLYYGTAPDLSAMIDRVMAVTAQQLCDVAQQITLNHCSVLTYR